MTVPFELSGEFAGFVRTIFGKRRMVLRTAAKGDVQLKVPKILRHQLDGCLSVGRAVRVLGLEDPGGGERRAVLRIDTAGASFTCPIQVCVKKNCWRQGGREIWRALEEELGAFGSAAPALEEVDCLDRCKQAPNLDCGAVAFERCTPEHARHFGRAVVALNSASPQP